MEIKFNTKDYSLNDLVVFKDTLTADENYYFVDVVGEEHTTLATNLVLNVLNKNIKAECKKRIKLLTGKDNISDMDWALYSQNLQDDKTELSLKSVQSALTKEETEQFKKAKNIINNKNLLREKSNELEKLIATKTLKELQEINIADNQYWTL